MSTPPRPDRRRFLATLALEAASIGLLGGCKRKSFVCNDPSALNEDDRQVRANVKYVDHTPVAGKSCDGCSRYREPKSGDCGGCTAFPGPVHPGGYCTLWVPKS